MRYDDVIMGAGSSGAALAARLSEDPNRSVLLLEAGPDYRTIKETPHGLLHNCISYADHDWGWSAQATPEREMPFYRGKVTGGCSAINTAVAIRGVPADYDEWAALGNEQWDFDKVLPYFRKLEHDADFADDLHGKGGPVWIERSKRSNWHPTVAAFHTACRAMVFRTLRTSMCRNRPEWGHARAFCATAFASRPQSLISDPLASVSI